MAPLSVSAGSSTGSPHSIRTAKQPSRPSIGSSRAGRRRAAGACADLGLAPPVDLVERDVRHVDVDDDRLGRQVGEHGRPRPRRRRRPRSSQCWSAIISSQPWPSTPNPVDRLADGDAADAAVAGGQRGPDRARVVDRPADVGARVDAGDDEVDRSEHAEAGEHHAQRRRPVDRPRLLDAVDVGAAHLAAAAGAARRAPPTAPEYSLSGATTTTSPSAAHRPGEDVQPDGVDPVVVGHHAVGASSTSADGSCRSAPIGGRSRAPASP